MPEGAPVKTAFPFGWTRFVPIAGEESVFPVRRIYCVGRNYGSHIREMNGDEREPPFFFQKPADAIVLDGGTVDFPPCTDDFQHEIELVLAIGRAGCDVPLDAADSHILGCAVGVDLTRRDLQLAARDKGRPWEAGKSFDQSAPIGAITRVGPGGVVNRGKIALSVNGETRQNGDLAEMIWSPSEVVSQLSRLYRLEPGDLIYTGTPAGVGKIGRGDGVEGWIEGVGSLSFTIG